MRVHRRIDLEAERVLRGISPSDDDPALAELAALVASQRAAFRRPPGEEVGERHLAAIVAEASAASNGSPVAAGRKRARARTWITPARRGRAIAFRLAATGLAALVGLGALAVAGVRPPAPLDSALERMGISTEGNGGASSESENRRPAPQTPQTGDESGPAAAREGAPQGQGGKREARTRGDERRSESGTESSAPGRATADQARGGTVPPTSPGRSGDRAPSHAGPPAAPGSQSSGKANPRGNPQPQTRRGVGRERAGRARGGPR